MALRRVYTFCNRKRRLIPSRLQNVFLILNTIHIQPFSTTSLDKSDLFFQDLKEDIHTDKIKSTDYEKRVQKNQEREIKHDLIVFKDINGGPLTITPDSIASIMSNALIKKDKQTMYLAIFEADRKGMLNSNILESCITQCIQSKDLETASIFLQLASDRKFDISFEICQKLLGETINYCRWYLSAVSAGYMIQKDYEMKDKAIFYIVGGLMKNAEGIIEALKLINLINDHKRSDLSKEFSYNKVTTFSNSSRGTDMKRLSVPREALEEAFNSSLKALNDGWFSYKISKLLVGLAVASRHNDIASEYINKTIEAVKNEKLISDTGDISLFQVILGFSQGVGVATKDDSNYSTRGMQIYKFIYI
jgi:hypothetical protein